MDNSIFFALHWYKCYGQITKLFENKRKMNKTCDTGSSFGGLFGSLLVGLGERAVQVNEALKINFFVQRIKKYLGLGETAVQVT